MAISVSMPKLDFSLIELVKQTTVEAIISVIDFIRSPSSGGLKVKETAVGLVLLSISAHLYYWHKYSFWSKRNVKTPRPIPIFGNYLTMMGKPRQEIELEWPKKYGKIYGFYVGTKPYLVIADAKVLRQVCIKDFDKFPNHFFVGVKNKYQEHFLIMQHDNHWRAMRAILTPTFSSGKIKVMHNILHECADELVTTTATKIAQDNSVTVELKELFAPFSMGSALRCFYGINLVEKDDNRKIDGMLTKEDFAMKSRNVFRIRPLRFLVSSIVPQPLLKLINFPLLASRQMDFFAENVKRIIRHRQNTSVKRVDYLQLLLEARANEKVELIESGKFEDHHALMGELDTKTSADWRASKLKLTEEEVTCQAMMLMMVATETTSTMLSHAIYLLAHHRDVQDTLYRELMKLNPEKRDNGNYKFDYEHLTSCVYLDCVVSETLRLMPPALFMDRVASEDYYIEDYQIWVPKGTTVNLSYYSILHDAEYWPNPDKFDPERFKPENKSNILPGSYCPFGIGPRACIGFRFALTEGKLALAKLICRFLFLPDSVYPPEPKISLFVLNEQKQLSVSISKRS